MRKNEMSSVNNSMVNTNKISIYWFYFYLLQLVIVVAAAAASFHSVVILEFLKCCHFQKLHATKRLFCVLFVGRVRMRARQHTHTHTHDRLISTQPYTRIDNANANAIQNVY